MKRLALIVALAAAGCGEQGSPPVTTAPATSTPAPALPVVERRRVRRLEARIQAHCVAVARSLVDPGAAPTAAEQARAFSAADDLIAAVRANPAAEIDLGQDLRLYLGDVIENLEGSNCDPRMIASLESGLATIPRP